MPKGRGIRGVKMMTTHKKKGKNNDLIQEANVNMKNTSDRLPAFFLSRVIGWCALAVVVLAITYFWTKSSTTFTTGLMSGAGLVALVSLLNGYRIWLIGKKKDYFTLRLTCVDARALNMLENLPSYVNPASNTAFRSGQQVTFTTTSGMKIKSISSPMTAA